MANFYLTNIHTRKIIPENGDFSQSVHVKICIIKKKTCPNENETEKSEKSEIEILKKTKKKQ